MTHAELVTAAAAWLARRKRCYVVTTDLVSAAGETPDALGWGSQGSYLVECKTSRADFLRDRLKPWRREDRGMGNHRYYLTPEHLLLRDDLPPEWGLLELGVDGKVRVVYEAQRRSADLRGELLVALSALRRIGQNPPAGVSVKCYTLETTRRTTLGLRPPSTPAQDPA